MQLSVVCADELCVAFGAGLALHVFCSKSSDLPGKRMWTLKNPREVPHSENRERLSVPEKLLVKLGLICLGSCTLLIAIA